MALLDYTDYEKQANKTLSSPDGINLANKLAAGVLSWAERRVGFTFAQGTRTDTFDGGARYYHLSCPINVSGVTVTLYNSVSGIYEAYASPATVRFTSRGEVDFGSFLMRGFQNVRVSYTAGWTDLEFRATDLHQALAELLVAKFAPVNPEGDGKLKRVVVGPYTEEYDTSSGSSNTDMPAGIKEVVDSYRPVLVF